MNLSSRISFNINDNFFSNYPELTPLFKHLEDSYNWGKISNIAWALLLDFHPKSMYKNVEENERRRMINTDYLGFQLDWEKHIPDKEVLKKVFLTKAQKYLIDWEQKLDERQNFIASIPYSQDSYELLDKMMGATEKMWKQYLTCLKDVEDEETNALGNSQESSAELELI